MAQIECKDLVLGYDNHAIIENLNFSVHAGDYLCVIGENGAGKTTLMKTLLGLQKPISGEILFGDGLRRNEIGYLPQQTDVQKDFPASVREIVLSGCQGRKGLRPFYSSEEKEIAKSNMEKMQIGPLSKKCYRELSGGQKQRVLLARALCAAGKLLLLDEPVAGLDPKVTSEMYQMIWKLNEEGITILMISHDMDAAMKYAGHILHISHRVFFGKKEEYLKSSMGKAFLSGQEGRGGDDR